MTLRLEKHKNRLHADLDIWCDDGDKPLPPGDYTMTVSIPGQITLCRCLRCHALVKITR